MGTQKDKLLARFLSMPSDFHYKEMVKFIDSTGSLLMLHKPHPTGIMKKYQLKQVREVLGL